MGRERAGCREVHISGNRTVRKSFVFFLSVCVYNFRSLLLSSYFFKEMAENVMPESIYSIRCFKP